MNNMRQIGVLKALGKELTDAQISWALGGSLLLHFEGINVECDDIDLLVDISDHGKLLQYLKKYQYTYMEPNLKYRTKHFYSLVINGIDIDIMVDFKIAGTKETWSFPFRIARTINVNGSHINLSSIHDWLIAYKLMDRKEKVHMIETYLNFKIETKRLLITHLSYDHFDDMFEYMSDEYTMRYEKVEGYTKESIGKLLATIVPYSTSYSIKLKETGKHIGHIYFGKSYPIEFKEYMIGYIINKNFHNKGFCTEAARAIIDYGFKHFDIHRVTAKCNPDNIASWKVMEKIGLQKEGHLKQRVVFKYDKDGKPIWWDELVYGVIIDDWN